MVSIAQVPNRLIERIWPQVVPHFEKGREYWITHYDLEDFKARCIKGNMQLWVQIIDKKVVTVLVTELISYPKCIYLRYVYVGGSHLRNTVKYVYIIENWAKIHGAVGYELLGRPQWSAFISRYKATYGEPDQAAVWFLRNFKDAEK